jgi:hypothetical protein
MVLLLAYANFQDRLILALDIPLEVGEPLEPLDVGFSRPPPGKPITTVGRRRELDADLPVGPRNAQGKGVNTTVRTADLNWGGLDFGSLQCALDQQSARPARIKLPVEPGAIQWGLVGRTYQPELADAWSACARAFGNEADQDPLLEQSMFWVITHALNCFY